MTDLAFYVRAVKNKTAVTCLEQQQETDLQAEVETTRAIWRHENGVTLCCVREIEHFVDSRDLCPECWISWQVIDDAGQAIAPREKHFHNACQEAFWLAMQA